MKECKNMKTLIVKDKSLKCVSCELHF